MQRKKRATLGFADFGAYVEHANSIKENEAVAAAPDKVQPHVIEEEKKLCDSDEESDSEDDDYQRADSLASE